VDGVYRSATFPRAAFPRFVAEAIPAGVEAFVEASDYAKHEVQRRSEQRYGAYKSRDAQTADPSDNAAKPTEHAHEACRLETRPKAAQPMTQEREFCSSGWVRPNGNLAFGWCDCGTPTVRSDAPPPREQIGAGPSGRLGDRQPFGRNPRAMSDLPPAIASWRDQIERLSEHASPCRYPLLTKWAAS
jgi:hypothetical protein